MGYPTVNQTSFEFAMPMRRVQTPVARRSDPATSKLAGKQITESGARGQQQAQSVAAVRAYPGHTSQELADLTQLDRYMLARRLPECITAGLVRKGEPRQCAITGKLATTWWPV